MVAAPYETNDRLAHRALTVLNDTLRRKNAEQIEVLRGWAGPVCSAYSYEAILAVSWSDLVQSPLLHRRKISSTSSDRRCV